MSDAQRGIIAASIQTLISIAGFVVAKGALHQIPAGPLLLIRCVPAAALLLLVAYAFSSERPRPAARDLWRLTGLGVLAVPLNQGFFYWGIHLSTAAHAALLYALTPALVLAVGVVRGTERVTPSRAGGIALAFAGVLAVLYTQYGGGEAGPANRTPPGNSGSVFGAVAQGPSPQALLGDLLMLVAVFSWALYTALSQGVIARLGAVSATAGALSLGALVYLPVGLALAHSADFSAVSGLGWLCVVWLVLFASVVSYLAWYYALQRLDPSRVAVFANLQPIGTSLIAATTLHQRLDAGFLAGSALVIGGVLLAQRRAVR